MRLSDCTEWDGFRDRMGYGMTWWEGRSWRVHRLQSTLVDGPIPPGIWVLHKCDNPPCFSLEEGHCYRGTPADNAADRDAHGRWRNGYEGRIHCPSGHLYDAECNGRRFCRVCKNENQRRRRAEERVGSQCD